MGSEFEQENGRFRFHVGDRVMLSVNAPDGNDFLRAGMLGTVRVVEDNGTCGIRFDACDSSLHSLGDRCEDNHGWYVVPAELTLAVEHEDFEPEDEACLLDFLMA